MDRYREATLRPRLRGERGAVGDGDGADDGQSEAVVIVDAGAVEVLSTSEHTSVAGCDAEQRSERDEHDERIIPGNE